MAIIKNGVISGLVGTVVMYSMNGKDYVRSRPKKRTKRKQQLPVNRAFSEVSKNGTPMIKYLAEAKFLAVPIGRDGYNSCRSWMLNLEKTAGPDRLLSLQAAAIGHLNPNADLRDFMSLNFQLEITDDGIEVEIPAINPVKDIRVANGTKVIQLSFILVSSAWKEPCAKMHTLEAISIDYSNETLPSTTISLNFPEQYEEDDRLMLAMKLEMYDAAGEMNANAKWLPAAVLGLGKAVVS